MADLPDRVKYLVIGAGVHGLSTAWHLAKEQRARGEEPDGRFPFFAYLTGKPTPTGSIAVFVTLWVVLLAVERFTLGFARSAAPVRLMTAPPGAHPGTGDRRGWKDEQRLPGARRWTRRGVVPVMITPPLPPTPAGA